MNDAAIIIALISALIAGAIVGAVGVLTAVATAIHRAASRSVLMPQTRQDRAGATRAELEASEHLDALREAEIERSFRLEGGYGAPQASAEASPAPTAGSSRKNRTPGCGWCLGLRKAIFGKK